ncbi:MAG: hypothetical protein P1U85_21165 [Verrucomicrobiales bacterium]|nr:hypothetical protein [Verrucomicrobiales bacterium]
MEQTEQVKQETIDVVKLTYHKKNLTGLELNKLEEFRQAVSIYVK